MSSFEEGNKLESVGYGSDSYRRRSSAALDPIIVRARGKRTGRIRTDPRERGVLLFLVLLPRGEGSVFVLFMIGATCKEGVTSVVADMVGSCNSSFTDTDSCSDRDVVAVKSRAAYTILFFLTLSHIISSRSTCPQSSFRSPLQSFFFKDPSYCRNGLF